MPSKGYGSCRVCKKMLLCLCLCPFQKGPQSITGVITMKNFPGEVASQNEVGSCFLMTIILERAPGAKAFKIFSFIYCRGEDLLLKAY